MNRTVFALGAALLAAPAFAQGGGIPQPPVRPPDPPLSATVSLDSATPDLRDALRSFAAQTGARILIATEVTGKVATKLDRLPLREALNAVTAVTPTRWVRLDVDRARADTLTAEQAAALVSAAETLQGAGLVAVSSAAGPIVTLTGGTPAPGSVPVYLVQTRVDPAAIKAAREDARKKAAGKMEDAKDKAAADTMSADAKQDPNVVKAYADLQNLNPDQVAVLAREFLIHSSPEQRQAIGDSMKKQHDQMRDQGQNGGNG